MTDLAVAPGRRPSASAASPRSAPQPPIRPAWWSLAGLGPGAGLIAAYVLVTRLGGIEAAKLGLPPGPNPVIFLTDLFLLGLVAIAFVRQRERLLRWTLLGRGAGAVGMTAWLLLLVSIPYVIFAAPRWGILAIKDFAIFNYTLIFVLAWMAIRDRASAERIVMMFVYAGAVVAVALVIDSQLRLEIFFSGGRPLLLMTPDGPRVVESTVGSGEVGATVGFTLAALAGLSTATPKRRSLHVALAALCAFSLMITQTRSALLGAACAVAFCVLLMSAYQRLLLAWGGVSLVALLAAFVVAAPEAGISRKLDTTFAAVSSAASLRGDGNFDFRAKRWELAFDAWAESPVFGVGFGKPLVPENQLEPPDPSGRQKLNDGLPHNSFITILARMGLLGLALLCFAWFAPFCVALAALLRRRGRDPHLAACVATMIAMLVFANFNLFLERPMHAASLWILSAVVLRLAAEPRRSTQEPAARRPPAAPIGQAPGRRAARIAVTRV